MWSIFKRDTTSAGSVLFRGNIPPRAENFSDLAASGISIRPGKPNALMHWALELDHPQWGHATLVALRDMPKAPELFVDYSASLSPSEKDAAKSAGTGVSLSVEAKRKYVLRDRKNLLRYLYAVMGDAGVAAVDHTSQLFWSPDGLREELAHDADLDIQSLFSLHAVTNDDRTCYWLHSHGLAEIGVFDFDILNPSEDVGMNGDVHRAIAYAIAGEKIKPGATFPLSHPGGDVRFVPAAEFQRTAAPQHASLRDAPDHTDNRVVLCEPGTGTGFFARLLGKHRARPSKFLSSARPEHPVFAFTKSATALMAERARNTIGILRDSMTEFAEFEFPTLVKLGYPVDGAAADDPDREHMWFSVHSIDGGSVEATLENQPYSVSHLKAGDRGRHDLALLSDWTMMTPAGTINPRSQTAARIIRENIPAIREAMKASKRSE